MLGKKANIFKEQFSPGVIPTLTCVVCGGVQGLGAVAVEYHTCHSELDYILLYLSGTIMQCCCEGMSCCT